MAATKKFYLLLLTMVLAAALFLYQTIRRSSEITVTRHSISFIAPETTFIPLSNNDPSYGNPGSAITIVVFNDFSCPSCTATHQTLRSAVSIQPNKFRLVWKHAPRPSIFSLGEKLAAHQAAYCAGKQNAFWEFADKLMKQTSLSSKNLQRVAAETSIDNSQWQTCLADQTVTQYLQNESKIAQQLGVRSAPGLFINNRRVNLTKETDLASLLNKLAESGAATAL